MSRQQQIGAVRHFNRFYTSRIGVLHEHLLKSPFSLTEMRVLFELAHRDGPSAREIGADLGLDAGYLSRILASFGKRGYVAGCRSPRDGRETILALTPKGHAAFAPYEARQDAEVAAMLRGLSAKDAARLVAAMYTIETLLGRAAPGKVPYILRTHHVGDMGWIVHRQGALYAQEYGWSEEFEALAAEILAKFLRDFDPKRERCWIAERDGIIVGSVFLVKKSAMVAKLRMLYVEPAARGLGIGRRLVDECIAFSRQKGYRKITLWTQSNLAAARHIYAQTGFRLVHSEKNHAFGKQLVSETWDLDLH